MNRSRLLGIAGSLLLSVVSCKETSPPKDVPLPTDELPQFHRPLQFAAWKEPGSWPQFGHDPQHSGRADVDLVHPQLKLAWRFQPTSRVWAYEPGFSVWSSPVVGTIEGRPLVIAGYQDRNVYAVDATSGRKAWEFQPGDPVFASPALGMVNDRPMVFVASMNRSVYGLDASTGVPVWQRETAPWSFTSARAIMSSPTVVQVGEEVPTLLVGVWNSDRSASSNLQSGECIAIKADDGRVKWRRRLSSVPLTSPAFARLRGRDTVFVACQDGTVHALRLADGSPLWEAVLNDESRSSPSIGLVGEAASVFIGSRLNTVFGLDAVAGTRRWMAGCGYWVDATPAWFASVAGSGPNATVVVGSYDRDVHALDARTGDLRWRTSTGNYAYSSSAIVSMGQTPMILTMSWDERLYLLDGGTGRVAWSYRSGPLVWSHADMGDSLWASPAAAMADQRPLVLFAALDGVLYAFHPMDKSSATVPTGMAP